MAAEDTVMVSDAQRLNFLQALQKGDFRLTLHRDGGFTLTTSGTFSPDTDRDLRWTIDQAAKFYEPPEPLYDDHDAREIFGDDDY